MRKRDKHAAEEFDHVTALSWPGTRCSGRPGGDTLSTPAEVGKLYYCV